MYSEVTLPQVAWLHGARHFAEELEPAGSFTDERLELALDNLKGALGQEAGVTVVPAILSNAGIRFVIVQHLSKTRIDGATFWLEDGSPVVAMSMRYERIDCFWQHVVPRAGSRKGWRRFRP